MDEIEKLITDRINSKRDVVEKLAKKKENTLKQIDVCRSSIDMMMMKVANTQMQVEVCESSVESTDKDLESKNSEVAHMDEILSRYRQGLDERTELSVKIKAIHDTLPEWTPGMPTGDSILAQNEEYQVLLKRKRALEEQATNAMSDVNKIYYNRGDVSGVNARAV